MLPAKPKRAPPLAAALVCLCFAAAPLRAGEKPPAPKKPPRSQELAAKAAGAELAARFTEAAETRLRAALELAARTVKEPDAVRAAAGWAEVEFLLEKGCALADAASVRKRLVAPLRKLGKLAARRPLLAGRVAWRLGGALRAAGDEKRAAREFARLGFITDWQIIGPFDNERGQGFSTAYGPEKGIDLAGKYAGKKRRVAWRPNPTRATDGLVDLAGALRPNRQAVAYLLTYIEVPGGADLPAAVRLGSGHGVRVWLNGREVHKREAAREPGFDQDAFGVTLRPGANALLVKVAQSEGPWGLRLRLTDPSGAALRGVKVAAGRALAHSSPAAGKPPAVERGAVEHFEKKVRANAKDVDALARLGFLTARAGAFDREKGARPDRDYLRRAARARPGDARLWYELSFVSAVGGRMRAETDQNPRRRALERSAKLAASAAVELELAAYYLRNYRNFRKTSRHLARARGLAPDALEVKLLEIELADERGDEAEAFAAAAKLAKFSPGDARVQSAYARLLTAAGNPAGAAEHCVLALRLDASDRRLATSARAHEKSGQAYRALEAFATLLARHPYRTGLRLERARLLAGRGDHAAAAAECRKGLAVCPEDHLLLARLAEYLDWLGKKKEASAARRKALELMPNFVELERRAEYLEGRASYDRKYRENVRELLAAAPKVRAERGEPGAYLLYKTIDRVHPDGTNSRTVHFLAKVLSEHGARRFALKRIVYYADEQRAVVRTARVHRAGGGTESAHVLPARTYTRAERKVGRRLVQFPSPSVGDVVELEYRIDDLKQGFFGRYFGNTFRFRREMPTLRAKYVLIVPQRLRIHFRTVRSKLKPSVTRDAKAGTATYTWTAENQEKLPREPMMPPAGEVSPAVEVSTYKDWTAFGKWYWGLIRKQHAAGPGVRQKARELAAGARTDAQKIRAIYNYVVTEIRYVAWEFGVHGFKPYRAEQIMARKFGDCKDKATLICSMLAEHGIKAHPVLIRSQRRRGKQDLELPLISHFNHCIVYVPPGKDRPEMWLDGTAAHSRVEALPGADRGARVAVITPGGALVRDLPASAPAMNATRDVFTLTLSADGSGGGSVRASATGNRSMKLRRHLGSPLYRAGILDRLHGRRNPGTVTAAVSFSDLRDLNVPVSYKYSLAIRRLARRREGLLELELPDDPLRGPLALGQLFPGHFATYAPGMARGHDLVLPAAWQHSVRYEVDLPAGWKVSELPADAKLETEFGKLLIKRKFEGGKLVIEKTVSLAATRVPAAKYPAFRKFCLDLDRLEARRVQLVKGPPPKPPRRNGRKAKGPAK